MLYDCKENAIREPGADALYSYSLDGRVMGWTTNQDEAVAAAEAERLPGQLVTITSHRTE